MALKQITAADLVGKGVLGQPDVPGLSAGEMQAKVEQLARELIIPTLNENAGNTYDKTEVDEAINTKMQNIGAGDMAKSVYDPENGAKQVAFAADTLDKATYKGGADGTVKNSDKLGGQLPGYYLFAPNLLDNSLFTAAGRINQRGVSGTVALAGYFLDRWKLVSGTVTLEEDGIVLNGTMGQVFEHSAGTETTVSFGMVSGTAEGRYDNAAKTLTVTSTGGKIAWVKCEKGSTATPYVYKGYAAEQAECRRYFIASNIVINMTEVYGSTCRAAIYFPVQMRTVPTITKISENGTVNVIQTTVDGFRLGSDTGNNYLGGYTASADL